jgi:hypothetical protein
MIRFSDSVSVSKLDEEMVLLDSRTGMYYGLNAVGSRLFELLSANPSRGDAVATLLGEFEVDAATLNADVDRFLRDLKGAGLAETDEV